MTGLEDIRDGVRRFREETFPAHRGLFEGLADQQAPRVLFIGCIDSRVDPALITGAEPGDMFVERSPGNLVPRYTADCHDGLSASIEYAVTALQVNHIIVCGHSDCGALKAALDPEKAATLPSVDRWLQYARPALRPQDPDLHALCERNVKLQIEHLLTHPCVQARLNNGQLQIHGWVYEIHTGEIELYDPSTERFAIWP